MFFSLYDDYCRMPVLFLKVMWGPAVYNHMERPGLAAGSQFPRGHTSHLPLSKNSKLRRQKVFLSSSIMYYSHRHMGYCPLEGHGNEADFVGFLKKLVPHRSLTLPFELFWFWLRIFGDIRNQKTTPRLHELVTLLLGEPGSRRVGESTFEYLKPTRWVGESLWWVRESLFKYLKLITTLNG